MWFGRGVDELLTRRFGHLLSPEAVAGLAAQWASPEAGPHGAVALLVLLDQFNRNIHRGSPAMFQHDARAAALARQLLRDNAHLDGTLTAPEVVHVGLCLTHSEALEDQEAAVELFSLMHRSGAPAPQRHDFEGHAHMARLHMDEIVRFGRFPHRNKLLSRETTAEEAAWLESNVYGYHRQVVK